MVYSICLKCPTTKTEKRNVVSQIKASQDTKPLNHNSDMIETPIIKEQEALEPISYPENSTLHNNSQNDPESRSRRNHLPLEISSIENDLISDTDIKQQTQDITNLQNVCSIEEALLGPDISFKKASLEDREMNAFLDREYKKKVSNEIRQRNRKKKLRDLDLSGTSDISSSESSISSHPIPNNPILSEQNAKIKVPEIDILYIPPKLFWTAVIINEIMSWYCYRRYFEKRHGENLPEILENGLIMNKKAYELASGQIYDEMLHEIGEDKIMRIKSYSANKLSKLTDMQIDTIKNHFTTPHKKNSRIHVISEMITSDATVNAKSEVNISTAPIPSTHVSNNSSNNSSRNGPVAVSISTVPQVGSSNRYRLPISILPDDSKEKRKHIIGLVLEQFPSLYLSNSSECDERFDLNSSTLCLLCNGDHKEESLWKDIRGEWGAGEYCGERTYHITCKDPLNHGTPIVSVKV
ncbi:uncharacterized protein OCT59_011222 [Rhizophagus irregularis]|nr:hypothetical protein OCT59_011222 [Rhizophagus irregularis]